VQPVPAHYEDAEVASDYRGRFSKSLARRISNRLELRMLAKALRAAGAGGRLLDVPCGTGRLVATLARSASAVVCVDAARAMLDEARRRARADAARLPRPPAFARGDAFALPFADAAFDVTVCWRLIQHFETSEDRVRILRELGRVTRRAIVLSFSDAGTARARRIARSGRARRGRIAITREQLGIDVAASGLAPKRFYRLFGPLSVVGAVLIAPR
jgi:ubiquinone/menaquinone biosynthesis C-methylase UbiE